VSKPENDDGHDAEPAAAVPRSRWRRVMRWLPDLIDTVFDTIIGGP
jgi:hypothetical protein